MSDGVEGQEHIACRVVSVVLKFAAIKHRIDVAERVWNWATPARKHFLYSDQVCDFDVALVYVQYVMLCARVGHIDRAVEAWEEWQASDLGASNSDPFSQVLRCAMVSALAMHGKADAAEAVFNERFFSESEDSDLSQSVDKSEHIILVSLLTAFSHAGLPDRCVSLLDRAEGKSDESGSGLGVEVYNAVVDSCARAGSFDDAFRIISRMRERGVEPNAVTWMSVLGPCRQHGDVCVAEHAFEELQATGEQESLAAAYVVMADVYKAAGDGEKAKNLHNKRKALGLYKQRGEVQVRRWTNQTTTTVHCAWVTVSLWLIC